MNNSDREQRLDFSRPLDYRRLMENIQYLSDRFPTLSVTYLGTSVLGRKIPVLSVGEGREKGVLYVGCHHGMEWITSVILLKFVSELCSAYEEGRRMYGINIVSMLAGCSVTVIPMLNIDGADIEINGVGDCILRDRLIGMNGSEDFSHWQANGRGVDLNHNYASGFREYKVIEASSGIFGGAPTRFSGEAPESEPEVGALCSLLRFSESINAVLTLHTQGEEIYYSSAGVTTPKSYSLAKLMSKITGYSLAEAEGAASFGGLTDWCIRELGLPSFTLECGKGENPLPLDSYFDIYVGLRELFFSFPIMI